MIIQHKNFSKQIAPPQADEYHNCNFSQASPGTRLWPGNDTPRRFVECNMVNAEPPLGSTLERCNTTQVERSVEIGDRSVTVAGRTVSIKRYTDRILGSLSPVTLRLRVKERELEVSPPIGTRDRRVYDAVLRRDKALQDVADADTEADLEVRR